MAGEQRHLQTLAQLRILQMTVRKARCFCAARKMLQCDKIVFGSWFRLKRVDFTGKAH